VGSETRAPKKKKKIVWKKKKKENINAERKEKKFPKERRGKGGIDWASLVSRPLGDSVSCERTTDRRLDLLTSRGEVKKPAAVLPPRQKGKGCRARRKVVKIRRKGQPSPASRARGKKDSKEKRLNVGSATMRLSFHKPSGSRRWKEDFPHQEKRFIPAKKGKKKKKGQCGVRKGRRK